MNENGRFKVVYSQKIKLAETVEILVDTETGVNYIYRQSGYSGGLTPLLDADGKPVVTK